MPVSRPASTSGGMREDSERRSRRGWLLPLVALIIGIVLGGGGVGLVMNARQAPAPAPAPTTAAPSPSGDVTPVNVPRACLRIADEAKVLQGLLDQAVTAARDLNASELSDLVRQIDEQQNALQTHAQVCRQGVQTPVPVSPGAPASSASAGSSGAAPGATTDAEPEPSRTAKPPATATPAPAAAQGSF